MESSIGGPIGMKLNYYSTSSYASQYQLPRVGLGH